MNQLDDHRLEVFDQLYFGGSAQARAPFEFLCDLSRKESELFEYSPLNPFRMPINVFDKG